MRPVKEKTYQDHTFALRIPLELDDDDLDLFKWTTFLDCALHGEDSHNAPPYTKMGVLLLATSSLDHYLQMGLKLQAYDIFYMSILNLHYDLIKLEYNLVNT